MSLQQLDLFGQPINPQPTPKKKVATLVKPAVILQDEEPLAKPKESIIITEEKIVETITEKRGRGRPRKPKQETNVEKIKGKRGRKSYAEIYADTDLANVPSDEKLKEKLYYSISEVAKWFNLTTSQLRFWEGEFDILKPRKNKKGDRLFRAEDINNLKTIYHLLRIKKQSIEGAKDYLKANQHKAEPQVQLQQSLQNIKAFLLELKANL